ncbi:hypothetical protein M6B38_135275 [Iris pallida]|uniref:Uncharacterized protein n=1 Tax=Iris pallida TaxID=29817 RepID=A0AAX6FFZ8_IRIPA|nr:hypothetical protein M6B38_135275 [Iris pallida]
MSRSAKALDNREIGLLALQQKTINLVYMQVQYASRRIVRSDSPSLILRSQKSKKMPRDGHLLQELVLYIKGCNVWERDHCNL